MAGTGARFVGPGSIEVAGPVINAGGGQHAVIGLTRSADAVVPWYGNLHEEVKER